MLNKKTFLNLLGKASVLALAGALLTALIPSASWAMDDENKDFQIVTNRPSTEGKSYFEQLNPACFKKIFYYISSKQLGIIARVSQMFYYESNKNWCWNGFIPGINSKQQYVVIIKNPIITLFNGKAIDAHGTLGLAYHDKQGPYSYPIRISTPKERKYKKIENCNFNVHIIDIVLKSNKKTEILLSDLPDNRSAAKVDFKVEEKKHETW